MYNFPSITIGAASHKFFCVVFTLSLSSKYLHCDFIICFVFFFFFLGESYLISKFEWFCCLSYCYWFSHFSGQRTYFVRFIYFFNLLTHFMAQHMVYLGECPMCMWKNIYSLVIGHNVLCTLIKIVDTVDSFYIFIDFFLSCQVWREGY